MIILHGNLFHPELILSNFSKLKRGTDRAERPGLIPGLRKKVPGVRVFFWPWIQVVVPEFRLIALLEPGTFGALVGHPGLEPGTSVLSGLRSNQLS